MRNFAGTALTVTATDQWLAYIQAGKAFALGATAVATAANIGHIQLFNPNASGKTVLVRRATVACGVVDRLDLLFYNTQLTTDMGAGTNLLSGAAAGVAHVRTQFNATELGTVISGWSNTAFTPVIFGGDWLVQLAPNQGVLVSHSTVNETINGSFWWAEI